MAVGRACVALALLLGTAPAQPWRGARAVGGGGGQLLPPPPAGVFEDEATDRRPRVALCLVGLFRDHLRRVLPSMRRALLNSSEWRMDVFIETWTTLGASRAARLAARTDETGGPLNPRWLSEYPNLVSLRAVRTPRNVSWRYHGVEMPLALVRNNPLSYGSTLPNLRRMRDCAAAKAEWEEAGNFTYAAVVKARPDHVCGGKSWAALKLALRKVLAHASDPAAQPVPFFHEHAWPHIMVSDKFAVGSSSAMDFYLRAWDRLPALFGAPRLADALGKRNHLMGERLLKVHMSRAPFGHMATFCCQAPSKRKKQGRCRKDYAAGGEMAAYFASARAAADGARLDEPEDDDEDGGGADAPTADRRRRLARAGRAAPRPKAGARRQATRPEGATMK